MKRENKIEIVQRIGVDQQAYDILRAQKTKQKKSMAEIVVELIINSFQDGGHKIKTREIPNKKAGEQN